MDKKIVFFACILLLFAQQANAHSIERQLIQVNIADDGTAKVTEKYFLLFKNSTDLQDFRKTALDNGSSLELWKIFDGNISTHIGKLKNGTGRVIFEDKQNEKIVILEYETSNAFMEKKIEGSRRIEWGINSEAMISFEEGSVYFIPNNIDISVLLPKNSQLDTESIVPTAVVSGNIVSWSGPISVSGNFVLNYVTEKQIAPPISISKTLQGIVAGELMPQLIIIALAIIGIAYFKKKTIAEKIENYVIDHSKLEQKRGRIEDELE